MMRSGLFLDDFWSNFAYDLPWSTNDCSTATHGGASEVHHGCTDDMGLAPADVQAIAEGWRETLQAAFGRIVDGGGYCWQMLQFPDGSSGSRTTARGADFFRTACGLKGGHAPTSMASGTRGTADGNSSTGSTSVIRASADAPIMLRFSQDGDGSHAPWFVQVRDTGSQEQGGTRTRTCTRALHQ